MTCIHGTESTASENPFDNAPERCPRLNPGIKLMLLHYVLVL